MTSLLNTTTTVKTLTPLPPHIKKTDVLSLLHNNERMLTLNPLLKSYQQLPPPSSIAFYSQVPNALKPSSTAEIEALPVFSVIESSSASSDQAEPEGADTWRGGWAKRIIPDEITYETSMQAKDDGVVTITHAPMGVHSVTTWVVRQEEARDGLVLESRGDCTSNRVLMAFIRTTLQDSYDKLAKDFVEALGKLVNGEGTGGENDREKAVAKETPTGNAEIDTVS
ncbi:Uncharacterized protein BP5553_03884 [Venustampulla echinocandica]|uniref:DUF7053 domain-containing protein n=1 Tax=Venustampulla echinocandica TaxID=2656787 RepID=A0A370TVI5_9HELO|nr:Uncharacterized protein BP5553_03884 [Venustampulla echinocandica]RDL39544.1 Uncharacterized protein BP5553_03884 [Venustampulla echinocandica]